ncbi:alpha-amylase family glycosyl hydrolase [Xanthobacter flavus]|uniref:alpha-amylase family glycosyl hydrolase n=1 Tax=Xanthobacter flavus TaxID=281 RepID=UPI001AE8AB7D|nr:alpha-amylase family glycosyl hydrolase [Xanthobacter flavus]MBP2150444.1 alpha-glucosidase [Xanthobacter flavus]
MAEQELAEQERERLKTGPVWWQSGVVYQIYPRSFQDSNGDGVGDIPGIISRLPYLADLGVDAIWISPIYPSPMADFGYDVADYTAIHPLFGTLDDFDRLVEEAHARGLKIILDFVPNHSSQEHPWFKASRSSKDDPKRDWYIWRDPGPDGGPPNNWLSEFGGSGWEYDEASGQYYYHAFLKEQPDLNWRNPDVVKAMHDALRFWMDRGVDGFRIDALWHVIKDAEFRDNPANPDFREGMNPHSALTHIYTGDRPEVMDVIAGFRDLADSYDGDRVLIGEAYLPLHRIAAYYGEDGRGVHLPFNFTLLAAPWNAAELAPLIAAYEAAIPEGGWPNWVLSNHDRPRVVGRLGPDQARVAAMLLLTLRGTPTLYYGDEIGMSQVSIPPERVQDPFEKNVPGLGLGRDGARTPMQWDDGPFAGFSTVEPWLPLADDFTEVNVKREQGQAASMLTLTRALLALRRAHPALSVGLWSPVAAVGDLVAYLRQGEGEAMLVALNLGGDPLSATLPGAVGGGRLLLSTFCDRAEERVGDAIDLRPNEGIVVQLAP